MITQYPYNESVDQSVNFVDWFRKIACKSESNSECFVSHLVVLISTNAPTRQSRSNWTAERMERKELLNQERMHSLLCSHTKKIH